MSRRVVWGVVRQEGKAVWLESAARVAWEGEAEEAWWTVLLEEAWVTGKVVGVWRGELLMKRGIGEDIVEMVWDGLREDDMG